MALESVVAAQPNISMEDIGNFQIFVPPIEEQENLHKYLLEETATIDTLISKYQKQIDLMQEYRTSLISQAVTGKIDLRDWQPKVKEYKTEDFPLSIAAEN
jgi:type I restriction enzyme S subunit